MAYGAGYYISVSSSVSYASMALVRTCLTRPFRTCKSLSSLALKPFFSSLKLKIERRDLPDLVIQAKTVGRYVRYLNLDLCIDTQQADWEKKADLANKDNLLADLVNGLPNVRSLTLHIRSSPPMTLPQFLQSVTALSSVRHLQIIEVGSTSFFNSIEPIRCPLSDSIIRGIVKSNGGHLLSLVFDGQSNIQLETFLAIRTIPTNLQTLLLSQCLGVDCRVALCEAVPWSCRNTLQHLGFYDCRGAHSGAIASGIGNKLWSTCLQTLDVCKSGDHGDAQILPYPIAARPDPPSIPVACLEHAFDWELKLFGQLQIQEVKLTLVPRDEVIRVLKRDSFRGLKKLIVGKLRDETLDDTAIDKACEERHVDLLKDGGPVLGCTCPYGMN